VTGRLDCMGKLLGAGVAGFTGLLLLPKSRRLVSARSRMKRTKLFQRDSRSPCADIERR
jgi:hypothetical protein